MWIMATIQCAKRGSDTLLGSLALLKTNLLPNDHISAFIPFLCSLFIDENFDEVKIDEIVEKFPKAFGFIVPRMPMLAILQNCVKNGILRREVDGRFYVNKAEAQKRYITTDSRKQAEKYNVIISSFQEYCFKEFKEFKAEYTLGQAENAIIDFLTAHSSKTLNFDITFPTKHQFSASKSNYVVARFITYCNSNNKQVFYLIQEIAMAHIIASALVDENEKTENITGCQYNSMILYLDTPVLLRILGLNTDEMESAYADLLKAFKAHNNVLKVFQHTFNELHGILSDCEKWIEDSAYNAKFASQALRTFVSRKFTKKDIQLFIANLEKKLKNHGVTIDDEDYYSEKYHYLQIDETPVREAIIKTYSESNPRFNPHIKGHTIDCDVKSISSIFKLRKKKVYRTYSKAKFLLITTNTTLAYLSRRFTADQNPSYAFRVYPCITDVLIGTSIWLSESTQKTQEFSRKKLLADCSAAIQPTEELMECLRQSIEKLREDDKIDVNDYYLLKRYGFEHYFLTGKTLNDESAFSDKITEEILEDIKSEIVAPYLQKEEETSLELQKTARKLNELQKERENGENQSKRKKEEATKQANKMLDIIEVLLIPFVVALTIFIIVTVTETIQINPQLTAVLNIIVAGMDIISICFLAFLHFDFCKTRTILRSYFEKRYLINQFKMNL